MATAGSQSSRRRLQPTLSPTGSSLARATGQTRAMSSSRDNSSWPSRKPAAQAHCPHCSRSLCSPDNGIASGTVGASRLIRQWAQLSQSGDVVDVQPFNPGHDMFVSSIDLEVSANPLAAWLPADAPTQRRSGSGSNAMRLPSSLTRTRCKRSSCAPTMVSCSRLASPSSLTFMAKTSRRPFMACTTSTSAVAAAWPPSALAS